MKKHTAALFLAITLTVSAAPTNPPVESFGVPAPIAAMQVTNVPVVSTNVPVHVLPVQQQAQDQLSQYLVLIIPFAVPAVIAFIKKKFPNLPDVTWPALASALGAVGDLVLQAANVQTGGTAKGALLGLAGVGLHQFGKQLLIVMPKTPPPPPPAAPAPNAVNPPPAPVAPAPPKV